MKKLILSILMVAALLAGCKKDKSSAQTIIGMWELRDVFGGQVANAPSTYKIGNGNIIEFTDTESQNYQSGKLTSKRPYVIVNASADIDGNSYSKAIIYDKEQAKWYYKITGNKLLISIGSIASDGVTLTYQRVH